MITSDYKQLSYALVNCSQLSHVALCLLSRSACNPFFLNLANAIPHSKITHSLSVCLSLSPSHHLPTSSSLNKLWFALTQSPTHNGGEG